MIALSVGLAVILVVAAVTIGVHRYLPPRQKEQLEGRRVELKIELPELAPLPKLSGAYLWTQSRMGLMEEGRWVEARSLRGEPWEYITSVFEQAAAKMAPSLFVLLTDQPAQGAAQTAFVHYEPFESSVHQALVIALSYSEKEACICADRELWAAFDTEFRELMRQANQLLQRDMVIEALVLSMLEATG